MPNVTAPNYKFDLGAKVIASYESQHGRPMSLHGEVTGRYASVLGGIVYEVAFSGTSNRKSSVRRFHEVDLRGGD